jgi:Spy/CpxP family protein refolding chaperone
MNRLLSPLVLPAAVAAAALLGTATARAADDYATYFKEQCTGCHEMRKQPLEDKHLTRQQWQDAVDKMVQMDKLDDPVPSKAFLAGLVDWLARTHGPQAK